MASWVAQHCFPTSLLPQLHAAVLAEKNRSSQLDDSFIATDDDGRVLCSPNVAIRVAPVRWVLPLRVAVEKLVDSDAEWRATIAVPAGVCAGVDDSLALLDPLAAATRHSATPTHAFGILYSEGGEVLPISVAWRLRGNEGSSAADPASAPVEVTRDLLHGKYMLDSPQYRAVQSVPWIDTPPVWQSEEERKACANLLVASKREVAAQHDAAAKRRVMAAAAARSDAQPPLSTATAAAEPAPPAEEAASTTLPPSASGRQVFLAWLAQQQAAASPAPTDDDPATAAKPAGAKAPPPSPLSALGLATALAGGGEGSTSSSSPTAHHPPPAPPQRSRRVYTDLEQVRSSLMRHPEFVLATERSQADIIWTGEHIRDFDQLGERPLPLLNQFPHESVLIAKNLLAECAQRRYGRQLPWLADTYTLPHELPAFVHQWSEEETSEELRSAAEGCEHHHRPKFIIKPWNMSRSRGMVIVEELNAALALCCESLGCARTRHCL